MSELKVAKFEFSLFGINTYVVYDPEEKECAIIDPGMINDRERDALAGFIDRNQLKVVHLINTHLHIDHCIGNEYVTSVYGIEPEAHSVDLTKLGNKLAVQSEVFGLPFEVKNIDKGIELKEGEILKIGRGMLDVIHAPGHSPGHIALYDKADNFIIVGDVLFQGSIGRTDLYGGNHEQLLSSIRTKLLTLPSETVVFPGHGEQTTIGEEARTNPFLAY